VIKRAQNRLVGQSDSIAAYFAVCSLQDIQDNRRDVLRPCCGRDHFKVVGLKYRKFEIVCGGVDSVFFLNYGFDGPAAAKALPGRPSRRRAESGPSRESNERIRLGRRVVLSSRELSYVVGDSDHGR